MLDFQMNSVNIQNILIAVVLVGAIVYGYIEFKKISLRLNILEEKISSILQNEYSEDRPTMVNEELINGSIDMLNISREERQNETIY